jgi:hypothetical protein
MLSPVFSFIVISRYFQEFLSDVDLPLISRELDIMKSERSVKDKKMLQFLEEMCVTMKCSTTCKAEDFLVCS